MHFKNNVILHMVAEPKAMIWFICPLVPLHNGELKSHSFWSIDVDKTMN